VDDIDIVESYYDNEGTQAMAMRMQGDIATWEGEKGATGGASEPAKSSGYLLSFIWEHGCLRYATIADTPANVSVLDASGRRVTLTARSALRLEAHETRNTLGVKTAPDGKNDREFQRMLALTEGWRDKIRASLLRKTDA
jgi:hypothetical protein